jgi:protein-L-isoaspartate(D-aspartate) O-methyltransferase
MAHAADDAEARLRRAMVTQIEAIARATASSVGTSTFDAAVMAAMGKVPRHRFVPPAQAPYAYDDRPLPIGHGQTISQPYIVALMTDLARVKPGAAVLEIGTGSGYQAAILAEMGARVHTIEIIEPLAREASARLHEAGYGAVTVKVGDGYHGWEEHAPFDAILVTAAASHVPPPLVRQLKPGGRMIVPVGAQFLTQYLTVVDKSADGTITTRQLLPVRFVPLTRRN